AVIAVRRLLARRWAAPLERDAVERNAVLLACLAGALGAVACADAFAIGVVSDPEGMSVTSGILLGFLAPVPLGAVPWMAGELLSGASVRQLRSLLASVAVSCLVSWNIFALCWMSIARAGLTPGLMVVQFAAAALAALAAGFAYLAARGDYSSSMSEKWSLLGCSSGFFWPGACEVCEPGCAGRCGVCTA